MSISAPKQKSLMAGRVCSTPNVLFQEMKHALQIPLFVLTDDGVHALECPYSHQLSMQIASPVPVRTCSRRQRCISGYRGVKKRSTGIKSATIRPGSRMKLNDSSE